MKKLLFLSTAMFLAIANLSAQMVLEFDTELSEGTSVTLPLYGDVNVTVNWGDSNEETFTEPGDKTHTYASEDTYTVTLSGTLGRFGKEWDTYENADKLVRITSFGDIGLTSLSGAFNNAVNLTEVPAQVPATVTNLAFLFYNATAFNQDIGGWDVSNVINMEMMFWNATSFNQDISNWDVSQVNNMFAIFQHVTLLTAYYNNLLITWAGKTLQNDVNFHAGNSRHSPGAAADAKDSIISKYSWVFTDMGTSGLPALITARVTEVTQATATSGGNVSANGGWDVTARGVVWHTDPLPDIETNTGITIDGDSLGSFISNLTGLVPGTEYYVRAYATNANGTDYGNLVSFITPCCELTLKGSFTIANKVYDGTTDAVILTNNLTLSGLIEDDEVTLTGVTAAFAQATAGDNITVSIVSASLGGPDKDKYSLSLEGAPTTTANIIPATNQVGSLTDVTSLYPNPFTDFIRIESENRISTVVFTDIAGFRVLEITGIQEGLINTSGLACGVYLVSITYNNGTTQMVKLVKQ